MSFNKTYIAFYALFLLSFIVFISNPSDASEKEEEKRQEYLTHQPEHNTAERADPLDLHFSIGLMEGYDSNANLDDSGEIDDVFTQARFNAHLGYPTESILNVLVDYGFTGVFYSDYTDASLLDHRMRPGIGFKPNNDLEFRVFYDFEALRYPENDDADYNSNGIAAEVEYRLTKRIRTKLEYEYLVRDYTVRRSLDGGGNIVSSARQDDRHRISGELRFYFDRSMLKIRSGYMRNDSNMVFQDYYDYEGLNAAVSYTQIITEKLYAAVSVNYMRTSYKSRKVSAGDETQRDDFCSPRVLVFYDITKDLTWLLTYSYNQADSNDPGQEYSGHMVTSGLYYSF